MSLFFFGGAALQTATATTPANIPPSVTAEDSLAGRTLTVTITDSDGNPAPTFDITMTADSVAVTPSGSGAGPWSYTVPSSPLDVLLEWEVTATNTEGSNTATGQETVTADLTATANLTTETDNTATAEVAAGEFTVTITQYSDYPEYVDYDEGNGPGVYVRNTADFATGPILLYPGEIIGILEEGEVISLGAPPLWIYEGTVATTEPDDATFDWEADSLGNGTFTSLSDTDESYTITSSEVGDTVRIELTITDDNGTTVDYTQSVSIPTVADATAPSFVNGFPADGATDVAIDANLVLTFSEDVVAGSGGEFYLYDTSGPTLIETFNVGTGNGDDSGTIAISGTDVTINPGSNLSQGTGYSIRWNAGAVEDTAANGVAANTSDTLYNFITAQAPSGGITYVGERINSDLLATQTFSAIDLGVGQIVVTIQARRNVNFALNSVTIDGVSASAVTDGSTTAVAGSGNQVIAAAYIANCTSATGDIVVEYSTAARCVIKVYLVPTGWTVEDVGTNFSPLGNTAPWSLSTSVNVAEGGGVIGVGSTASSVVFDFDALAGGTQRGSIASLDGTTRSGIVFDAFELSAETGRAMTVGDTSGNPNTVSLVAISLTPP